MIEYNVKLEILPDDAFDEAFRRLPRALEAAARNLLSSMRRYELDAPGPGPPAKNPFRDRLRRITGNLSDGAFIRSSNNGFTQSIVFPAPYAQAAFEGHGRDIAQSAFARHGRQIQADIERVWR